MIEEEIRKEDHTIGLNGVAVLKTTFATDFSIADCWGEEAVIDTYKRSFDSFKDDIRYITSLSLVLNHKIWEHYKTNEKLAKVYNRLWLQLGEYVYAGEYENEDGDFQYDHYTRDEISYYVRALD